VFFFFIVRIKNSFTKVISLVLCEGGTIGGTRFGMCDKHLLLKTQVVAHPGASYTGWYVHSERFRSWWYDRATPSNIYVL